MGRFKSIGTIQPFLKLQAGEWADVYKAFDASTERNVLLKKLKTIFENDVEIATRFEAEARLMSQIRHPNVVSVLASGRSGNGVYFVAEFVEGPSLATLLEHGAIPPEIAAYMLREMVLGLKAAHEKQIFHRDIKPANVLISTEGEVKLTDFGMASLMDAADDEELRGTIGFLAPELLFEGEPGPASDLFSVGATFYEMLSGRAAFTGESSQEIFDQILNYDPISYLSDNPIVYPELKAICQKALAKTPELRYANCDQLLVDVNAFLDKAPSFSEADEMIVYLSDPDGYRPSSEIVNDFAKVKEAKVSESIKMPVASSVARKKWMAFGVLFIVSFTLFSLLGLYKFGWFDISTLQTTADLNVPVHATEKAFHESDLTKVPAPDSTLENTAGDMSDDTKIFENEGVVSSATKATEESASILVNVNETPDNLVENVDTLLLAPDSAFSSGERIPVPDVSSLAGQFNVLCTPFCEVVVDGNVVGEAPPMLALSLPAGVHRLELHHPTLPLFATDIVVTGGETDSLKVALRDFVGEIELNVLPWAKVFIDDEAHGEVPPSQSMLLVPGKHIVRLEHDWGVWRDTLLVVAGESRSYDYNLRELLKVGRGQ